MVAGPAGVRRLRLAAEFPSATWQQLTGSGVLPAADFTVAATAPRHPERLYAASDGAGRPAGVVAPPAPAAKSGAPGSPAPYDRLVPWRALLAQPEVPYAALGAAALLMVLAALARYLRDGAR